MENFRQVHESSSGVLRLDVLMTCCGKATPLTAMLCPFLFLALNWKRSWDINSVCRSSAGWRS